MAAKYMTCAGSKDRKRRWEGFIAELFGPAEIYIPDESQFFGEIRSSSLGRLGIARVCSSYELGKRNKSHLAGETEERLLFVILKAGALHIAQGSRECKLEPGMCTLFDCSAPYVFQHNEPAEVVSICFPGGLLSARLRDPHRYIASRLDNQKALNRILCGFLDSITREVDSACSPLADRLSQQVTDLVACAIENGSRELPIEGSAVQSAVYHRCVSFIEGHLANPDLDPATIAAAIGISVRYLHSIFHAAGQTVGEYTRKRRLQRSYEELRTAGSSRLSVKEIAYRNGFRNAAHFANAFKIEFEQSPSDVRSARA